MWEAVCETERENQFGKPTTKHVSQRGGFTAIDAYHQIHVATGLWGPLGFPDGDPLKGGWGFFDEKWATVRDNQNNPIEVVFEGTFWYEARRVGRFCADVKYRPGDDCRKKTLTDALTKALSYLGFSADVFLGAFDSNKYTDERPPPPARSAPAPRGRQGQGGSEKGLDVPPCTACRGPGRESQYWREAPEKKPRFYCPSCKTTSKSNGRQYPLSYGWPKDFDASGRYDPAGRDARERGEAPAPEPPPQDEPPVDAYENEAGDDPTASW